MKKLFVFHMIVASIVCSARADDSVTIENVHTEEDQIDSEFDDNSFFDDISASVQDVVVPQNKPTYYDYVKVAIHACYFCCLKKPYDFCKVYLDRLRLLLKQKRNHEENRKTSI